MLGALIILLLFFRAMLHVTISAPFTGVVGKTWTEGRENDQRYVSIDIADDGNFVFQVTRSEWARIEEGQEITVTVWTWMGGLSSRIVIDSIEEASP